jgi:hypothetical protein
VATRDGLLAAAAAMLSALLAAAIVTLLAWFLERRCAGGLLAPWPSKDEWLGYASAAGAPLHRARESLETRLRAWLHRRKVDAAVAASTLNRSSVMCLPRDPAQVVMKFLDRKSRLLFSRCSRHQRADASHEHVWKNLPPVTCHLYELPPNALEVPWVRFNIVVPLAHVHVPYGLFTDAVPAPAATLRALLDARRIDAIVVDACGYSSHQSGELYAAHHMHPAAVTAWEAFFVWFARLPHPPPIELKSASIMQFDRIPPRMLQWMSVVRMRYPTVTDVVTVCASHRLVDLCIDVLLDASILGPIFGSAHICRNLRRLSIPVPIAMHEGITSPILLPFDRLTNLTSLGLRIPHEYTSFAWLSTQLAPMLRDMAHLREVCLVVDYYCMEAAMAIYHLLVACPNIDRFTFRALLYNGHYTNPDHITTYFAAAVAPRELHVQVEIANFYSHAARFGW